MEDDLSERIAQRRHTVDIGTIMCTIPRPQTHGTFAKSVLHMGQAQEGSHSSLRSQYERLHTSVLCLIDTRRFGVAKVARTPSDPTLSVCLSECLFVCNFFTPSLPLVRVLCCQPCPLVRSHSTHGLYEQKTRLMHRCMVEVHFPGKTSLTSM